jgi:signal transduction histidine kinase/ligand-binding sensor domain-containing protein
MKAWIKLPRSSVGKWVFPLGLLSLAITSIDTAFAIDPTESLSELSRTQWTSRDGAPANMWQLAQTQDGYLWVGAFSGLFRFDGERFEPFTLPDGSHPLNKNISAVCATPSGDLWAGTRLGGEIYVLHDGALKKYGQEDGLPRQTVYRIRMRDDGSIWALGTVALSRFDGSKWHTVADDWKYPVKHANVLFSDKHGTLWSRGPEGTYYLPHGATAFVKSLDPPPPSYADYMFDGPDGSAWGLDDLKLKSLSAPARSIGLGAFGMHVFGAESDREGSLWVFGIKGDDPALVRLANGENMLREGISPGPNDIQSFKPTQSQIGARDWLEDKEGNVWIATEGSLERFRSNKLHSVGEDGPTLSNAAMTSNEHGEVWIMAASSNQVLKFLPGESHPAFSAHVEIKDYLSGIWSESDGSVLVAINRIPFSRFANGKLEQVPSVPNAKGLGTRAPIRDHHGDLWVVSVGDGLYRQKDGAWTLNGGVVGLPHETPLKLFNDKTGRLLIGYSNNRLAIVEDDRARLLGEADGLNVDSVMAIDSKENRLWVGGPNGLLLFVRDHFWPVTGPRNTPFSGVQGIIEATDGALWINGSSGIVHIPPSEVSSFIADHNHPVISETLNYEDGLKGFAPDLIPSPTEMEGSDGRIWFITNVGVYWIDPKHILRNPIPPPVLVQAAVVDGQRYQGAGMLELPKHTRSFEIDYTALSLGIPSQVRFKYKLQGIDSEWQDAGSRRQAYYTNVPPGLHQFDVIAANQDGVWNTVGASTAIVIPPAFYQTRWFYTLCGIALLALIWQIYRLRLTQIKNRLGERLRERERIARELHDTLIQSAQGLILIFQGFAGQLPRPDPMRKNMETALDQADSLLNEARERVMDLRTTGIDSDVGQALTRAGEDLFQGTEIQFSVVSSGRPLPLMRDVADDIFRIGREALTNASMHAKAKSVEIEITFEPEQFRLRVRDDGVGISPEIMKKGARPNHFGLQGMRERAERMGGRLEIWGRASAGSEIDLKIPAKAAYQDLRRRVRWIPSFFQQPPRE